MGKYSCIADGGKWDSQKLRHLCEITLTVFKWPSQTRLLVCSPSTLPWVPPVNGLYMQSAFAS